MKKVLLIILALALFGSCKKNVLDIVPTDRISENTIWTDATLPQLFINSQYNYLKSGFADDIQYFGDDSYSQFDLGGYQTVARGSLSPSTVNNLSSYFNYWNTAYTAIRNFNIFFQKIDETPIPDEQKNQMKAEVKFLRAFVYSKLICNYGGVPIVEKVYTLNEQLTGLKRNSYAECVAYILKDIDESIGVLPDQQTGANLGRASADAARALKSRVLLYYASPLNNPTNDKTRWQAASDAALELINGNRYSLYNNFHGLFIGEPNNEAIFSRYYSTDVSHNVGSASAPVGSGGNGHRVPSQNLVDAFEMTSGIIPVINGVRNPDPLNTYNESNPYVNRDPRFYATALYNGATYKGRTIQPYKDGLDFLGNDATPTGYYLYKFIDQNLPVATTNPYTYPWHYFRLAEIYLNYAEAQYNLGDEVEARLYINKVRARTGVDMPPITETGTALFTRLVHECQVEFAMEGHRYYDVRRWKIAPQTEVRPIQGFQVTKNSDNSFTYNRVNLLPRVWDDKFYYLPISFENVQSSGGSLEQNPGY
nr:RagB/SusD family nutrient uptake outer membrane protein [Mucilaginibacter sp. L294]